LTEVKTFEQLATKTLRLLLRCERLRFVLPWRVSDWRYLFQQVLTSWVDAGYTNFNQVGIARTDKDLNKRLSQKLNQRIKKFDQLLGEGIKPEI